MMRCGMPLELHRHENAIAQTDQPSGVEIPVNLRILRPPVINHMLVDEVGLVPIEPIRDKDGDVILPGIPRGSGEQYPLISLGDFQECFCPSSVTDDSLLVKYKEAVFHIFVLGDVVPRVDDDFVLVVIAVLVSGEQEWS